MTLVNIFKPSVCDRAHSQKANALGAESKAKRTQTRGFHEKYYLGDKLGKGSFGCVYSAIKAEKRKGEDAGLCSNTDTDRAVKIIDLRCSKGDKWHRILMNEVAIWSKLKDQSNCVALYEFYQNDGLNYMVMEKCQPLMAYMECLDCLDERSLGKMFVQMLMGLKQLHSLEVIHRDIKPDNFFVGAPGNVIKLGDFGLSKSMPVGTMVSGECGTAPFMCPEMIAGEEYDLKADVWSFGVLVYALLFGRFPYTPRKKDAAEMKLAILEGKKKPDFGSYIPLTGSALAFSMSLLHRDPKKRPSSADAVRKEFMFSVLTECHEMEEDLPSLRPVLRLARKAHAFEDRPLAGDGLDEALGELQMKHLGVSLAETSQVTRCPSNASSGSNRRSSTHGSDMAGKSLRTSSFAGGVGFPPRSTHESSASKASGKRSSNGDGASKSWHLNLPQNFSTTSTRLGSGCASARMSKLSSEASFLDDNAFHNQGSESCEV